MIDVPDVRVYYFIVAVVRSSVNDKGHPFCTIARTGSCTGVSMGDVSQPLSIDSSSNDGFENVVTLWQVFLSRRRFCNKTNICGDWLAFATEDMCSRFPE
jgi:hypothetical protein